MVGEGRVGAGSLPTGPKREIAGRSAVAGRRYCRISSGVVLRRDRRSTDNDGDKGGGSFADKEEGVMSEEPTISAIVETRIS
jgi:hypothetical protein